MSPPHLRQLICSLLVAAAIVAIAIAVTTAKLGPNFGGDDDHSGHGRGGDRVEQSDDGGRGRGGDD